MKFGISPASAFLYRPLVSRSMSPLGLAVDPHLDEAADLLADLVRAPRGGG
jgi:hypothetical protein